jgi:tripartite-type tricarboxylate transporter receptor subunit TctC
MKLRRRRFLLLAAGAAGRSLVMRSIRLAAIAALLAGGALQAVAQSNYPDRNIRLLFGFAPGVDTAARLLADRLGGALGKAVIVENVTGASGHIAADHVAKASPDGYIIGVMPAANIVVDGTLYKKLSYDPLKDLAPVTQVYGYTDVLVVNNDVQAKDVAGLVALARAKPGQLTYGHSGIGTSLHLAAELFKTMAHVDVQQVPFRGSSLVITDIIGGRISMSFIPPIGTLSIILEGKVRALAVTSLERAPFLPDVPTMDESGFPGFDVTTWWGMFVPAATSAAVVGKLNRATAEIMARPDMRDKLRTLGIVPLSNTPAQFADVIRAEAPYWARLIKDAGIAQIE